jgi:hypothetical protein
MNEAIDELFRYRYRNLSMIIAEDGTVLRLEKKHNYSCKNKPLISRNGWLSPILSSFSLRFRDDKTLAVTTPFVKPLKK